jgi:hypothetical protein
VVALALSAVIAAALTPVLSPYRLAANSQYALALTGPSAATDTGGPWKKTPFQYLRFDAGRYGRERLKQLAQLQNAPNAAGVRELAARALAQPNAWQAEPQRTDPGELVKALPLYPAGRALQAPLATALVAELEKPENYGLRTGAHRSFAGLYVDLRGDGLEEFVLLSDGAGGGLVFEPLAGSWRLAGHIRGPVAAGAWAGVRADLDKGNIAARPAPWKELWVGARRFVVDGSQ